MVESGERVIQGGSLGNMSLTMVSIVIVLSSVGSVSSYAMLSDAAETGLNPLHSGIHPEPACDEPAEDVPPPGFRSVLRSVRRLVAQPELRRLPPPAAEPLTLLASPLPTAPPLALPAASPAPIGPNTRFLATRSAPHPAAVLAPQSDNAEPERSLDRPPIIQIQTSHPAQISVGRTMRLILAVRNAGASPAGALRIRTTLPEQAVFVASHPEPSAAEQGVLHFELGDLPAGAVRQIDLELLPRAAGPIEVKNVADFSVASCALIHIGRPQLSLTCQAPQAAELGDHVRYRLVIRNTGDALAEQVMVEPQVVGAGHRPQARRRFSVGDLAPGASREITLSDAARRPDALLVRFFASDRNGSEAEAEVCVQVRRPAVEITLTGADEITLGDEGLFEIRAANTGGAAVEPVRVACAVGDGLRLTVVDQQVQFSTTPGQLTWAIGRLAGGETRTLRFHARPVTAGEQQIRVTLENGGDEMPRYPRPAAEKTISIRDRTVDERTACR